MDVVLHRHPAFGFLLHLSEFRGAVVVYALRSPPPADPAAAASTSSSRSAASATKAVLDAVHRLPELPDGVRPSAPAPTLLVVQAVNGCSVDTFDGLAGLLACARASDELCSWSFVECHASAIKSLPSVCRLARNLVLEFAA